VPAPHDAISRLQFDIELKMDLGEFFAKARVITLDKLQVTRAQTDFNWLPALGDFSEQLFDQLDHQVAVNLSVGENAADRFDG
jgi:hypothetical protein